MILHLSYTLLNHGLTDDSIDYIVSTSSRGGLQRQKGIAQRSLLDSLGVLVRVLEVRPVIRIQVVSIPNEAVGGSTQNLRIY